MFYQLYELNHAAMAPWRAAADAMRLAYRNPFNPVSHTNVGRAAAAGLRFSSAPPAVTASRPSASPRQIVDGKPVDVHEKIVWREPFCDLLHFERDLPKGRAADPKVLIVAPMSGHYATLLRGTVEALLPQSDIYITDWMDARMVPLSEGTFDLDDYIDYVIEMLHHLGRRHPCDRRLPARRSGACRRRR